MMLYASQAHMQSVGREAGDVGQQGPGAEIVAAAEGVGSRGVCQDVADQSSVQRGHRRLHGLDQMHLLSLHSMAHGFERCTQAVGGALFRGS